MAIKALNLLLRAIKELTANELIKQFHVNELYLTDYEEIQIPLFDENTAFMNLYIAKDNLNIEYLSHSAMYVEIAEMPIDCDLYNELMNSGLTVSYI